MAPAAHYFIGGIAAQRMASPACPGCYALGEAACSGVHGANRLASNSLLEGLVFGTDAAELLTGFGRPDPVDLSLLDLSGIPTDHDGGDLAAIQGAVEAIQRTMSQHVAVVRSAEGLSEAAAEVAEQIAVLERAGGNDRVAVEARNIAQVAARVIDAALFREESRGAHFRDDFPVTDPDLAGRHSLLFPESNGVWRFGTLSEAYERSPAAREAAVV